MKKMSFPFCYSCDCFVLLVSRFDPASDPANMSVIAPIRRAIIPDSFVSLEEDAAVFQERGSCRRVREAGEHVR